jgi:hypothetical protein
MGGWDSHNTPLLELPEWNLRAELAVEFPANETASSHQVYLYIHTGEIRFRRPDGSFVPLEETPAVAFSEVLRDVDLFGVWETGWRTLRRVLAGVCVRRTLGSGGRAEGAAREAAPEASHREPVPAGRAIPCGSRRAGAL